jgi:hypothetical protein
MDAVFLRGARTIARPTAAYQAHPNPSTNLFDSPFNEESGLIVQRHIPALLCSENLIEGIETSPAAYTIGYDAQIHLI